MTLRPMPVSEQLHERLIERAGRLHLTPEQLIDRMLDHDAVLSVLDADGPDALVPPAGSDEALAAVRRLTTLFADTTIPDLARALMDPMITLNDVDFERIPGIAVRTPASG